VCGWCGSYLGSRVGGVGVGMPEADPSNGGWFTDPDVTSVDDRALVEGKVALVYALLGETGRFGVKDSAERLLPPPPDRPATRR